jgi:excisionase family DNA binding protein
MTTDPDVRLLLTIDEACERLSISRPTFYELVHAGKLRSIKIGAARRVPASALEEFVSEELRIQGQQPDSRTA